MNKPINVCMQCGNEWEQEDADYCPQCKCGDFYTEENEEE